jgi:predicted MFS family arabinose efflux permease
VFDGIALAFVCVGYGFAETITGNIDTARVLASVCFVADNLLFALGTGRSVYVSRLAKSAQEMASTLAMGVSVNHIASMIIPAIGGFIWETFGYERVFTVAALLALFIAVIASRVPGRRITREG